jgi:hypothetical protein
MDISVSRVLPIGDLKEYKIHFAVWNGTEEPLDVFVRDRDEWEGWNSWRGRRDDFNRTFILFDNLMVYLTIEDLKKFSTSDITLQKLIENSFVLLNGDRIDVKL